MTFQIVSGTSHIADAYYSLKRYRENIDRLDRLAIHSWLDEGICHYALGGYGEAIKCYNMALERDPNSARASYLKGLALDKGGVDTSLEVLNIPKNELDEIRERQEYAFNKSRKERRSG